MAHGVLNTEVLQDIAVSIAPIDPSGASWDVGAALVIALDRFAIRFTDETVRVDAGQQGHSNQRGVKWNYNITFSVKCQLDDYTTGQLRDLLFTYGYFRFSYASGGVVTTYDAKTLNFSAEFDESNAGMITFEGEEAYA